MNKNLNLIEETPLSDAIIKQYLPSARILKYSELANYNIIDDLLPYNKSYFVLLIEKKLNEGHWVCVLRQDDKIEFFDSYGGYPSSQLEWSKKNNYKLGQNRKWLNILFDNSPLDVIYNKIKFQSTNDDINTCGRHCICRIKSMLMNNIDLDDYHKLLENIRDDTGLTFDEIVSIYIDKI